MCAGPTRSFEASLCDFLLNDFCTSIMVAQNCGLRFA
jgi:hypothetical protein